MANVIDDQERVRRIQMDLLSKFNRECADPASVLTDDDIKEKTLDYILSQVKANVSRQLNNIETAIRVHMLWFPGNAVECMQLLYDLTASLQFDYFENYKSLNPRLCEEDVE